MGNRKSDSKGQEDIKGKAVLCKIEIGIHFFPPDNIVLFCVGNKIIQVTALNYKRSTGLGASKKSFESLLRKHLNL